MNIKPIGERILVKPVAAEERTAGGILLPDSAQEKPQLGEVVAVGPGRALDQGGYAAMEVKVGDTVLYSKYSGTEIKDMGDEYLMLGSEKDVLAIVEA